MTELLLNPHIFSRVREEVSATVEKDGKIQEAKILELPYLQAVIKESMRLHLAVPLLVPHKAETEIKLGEYVVPKNTQILVNAWAIARDPKYWDNPLMFNPERFLGNEVDYKGQHFEFLPFGSGRRICPGIPLALRVVSFMVASFVYHFDWRLAHAREEMDMDVIFGLTLIRETPLVGTPVAFCGEDKEVQLASDIQGTMSKSFEALQKHAINLELDLQRACSIPKRTMLSAAKVPLFFWAKAIATTCFTQNRSLVIPRHEKHLTISSMPGNRQSSSFTSFSLLMFNPERFLGNEVDYKGQHFEFLPFGSGRRICPGIPLDLRVVSFMVASFVYHFDWRLAHAREEMDMDVIFGLTLIRATPLVATLVPVRYVI
ncbi:geraniol 8-hydroxylase-like protein [Tanacetum coccineum]